MAWFGRCPLFVATPGSGPGRPVPAALLGTGVCCPLLPGIGATAGASSAVGGEFEAVALPSPPLWWRPLELVACLAAAPAQPPAPQLAVPAPARPVPAPQPAPASPAPRKGGAVEGLAGGFLYGCAVGGIGAVVLGIVLRTAGAADGDALGITTMAFALASVVACMAIGAVQGGRKPAPPCRTGPPTSRR
ncbi:hypothetical protein ABT403_34800 [Streptomyces sp. NPDC000075]|uniref:hypothetical protein n=1 Tax=Streptomyces TaxID=1883 RepID=UPI0031DB71D4